MPVEQFNREDIVARGKDKSARIVYNIVLMNVECSCGCIYVWIYSRCGGGGGCLMTSFTELHAVNDDFAVGRLVSEPLLMGDVDSRSCDACGDARSTL